MPDAATRRANSSRIAFGGRYEIGAERLRFSLSDMIVLNILLVFFITIVVIIAPIIMLTGAMVGDIVGVMIIVTVMPIMMTVAIIAVDPPRRFRAAERPDRWVSRGRADISIWWMGGRRESQFSLGPGCPEGRRLPLWRRSWRRTPGS